MYVILVNDDNTMFASKKERIMQRSKLVDTLWFLVNPIYKGCNMADFTVTLEYVLPVSKKYCTETLVLSNEGYKEYLKYLLPFDTKLTAEAGRIELQLTFTHVDLDTYGKSIQRVRKTSTTFIEIIPISAWSDIIPDSALSVLDQKIIKIDSQIKALNEMNEMNITLNENKADNLKYNSDNNTLQLLSGDKEIGNKVTLKSYSGGGGVSEDGIPVVDFSTLSDDNVSNPEDTDKPTIENNNNVVEF